MAKTDALKIISFRELFKISLTTYRNNWEKFVTLIIIPLAFSFFSNLLFYFFESYYGGLNAWLAVVLGIFSLAALIIFVLLYSLANISQMLLLKDLDQPVDLPDLPTWIKKARPYFWRLIAIAIIYFVFSLIGVFALIIPGLMFMIYYSLTVYVAIFEDKKIEESFGNSRGLVSGYFWSVFFRFLVGLVAVIIVYAIISIVFWLLAWLLGSVFSLSFSKELISVLYNLASVFISLVFGPLSIIYTYNIYKSLKEVKQ